MPIKEKVVQALLADVRSRAAEHGLPIGGPARARELVEESRRRLAIAVTEQDLEAAASRLDQEGISPAGENDTAEFEFTIRVSFKGVDLTRTALIREAIQSRLLDEVRLHGMLSTSAARDATTGRGITVDSCEVTSYELTGDMPTEDKIRAHLYERCEDGDLDIEDLVKLATRYGLQPRGEFLIEQKERIEMRKEQLAEDEEDDEPVTQAPQHQPRKP